MLPFFLQIKTVESKAREIPIGDNYLRVSNFRENDINTVTTTFYQAGPVTPFLHACLELLVSLLEEPLFDMLRTKEQLGYDVSTTLRDNAGILGLSFTIHSQENKFNYQYIDERIEIFNQNFLELLHKMTDIDFELVKTSLKHRKQVVDTDLKNEASRNWGEITTEEYIFNRNSLEVQEIIKLSKTDVLRLFQTLVMDPTTRRKLCVQVVGNNDKITNNTALTYSNIDTKRAASFQLNYIYHEEPLKDDCRYIGDIESFTKQLKVYNMVKMDFCTGN